MNPKERAIAALELREPDDIVPLFDSEFHLTEELLGKSYASSEVLNKATGTEREKLLEDSAKLFIEVAERLDYSLIRPLIGYELRYALPMIRMLKDMVGDTYLIVGHVTGTFSINANMSTGKAATEFSYRLYDAPDDLKKEAERRAAGAIDSGRRQIDCGADVIMIINDWCDNNGPFISPKMFSEFVIPYLYKIITALRKEGAYTIIHSHGNLMPVLAEVVACEPHGLNPIDSTAGMDIGEVKRLVGDKVCVCGNVSTGLLDTGSKEDVIAETKRCIEKASEGGGHILMASSGVFKDIPLENYLAMLEVREKYGRYPMEKPE